jgi:EAL domain-containing protein (putative c-di-GMP-specific phosphodiesterase class I)
MSSSFSEFVMRMQKSFSEGNLHCSILQLTVRNYDQLSAILSEDEISKFDRVIRKSIEKILEQDSDLKIFEHNKFYYLKTQETDELKISKLSHKIHDCIISSTEITHLLDVRIVGARVSKDANFINAVMLLADRIHYAECSQIFSYINNPSKEIERIIEDYTLLNELRDSISSGSACFAFQPVVACSSNKVAYHECLLRLSDDDYRLISAGKYIMLAEKYGYITFVDKYVFEMAINELKNSEDVVLSVNISNIGVVDKILVEHIKNLILKAGIGNRLIIEITETSMNNNFADTKKFVDEMKKLGCKIALDDFGAGYTSFNQVREFAIDVIKIDGSFIKDLDVNEKNRILVDTLIKTAEELGCKTVAEFVESGPVAKNLIEMKVDFLQGNFFSPAINYRSWEKK